MNIIITSSIGYIGKTLAAGPVKNVHHVTAIASKAKRIPAIIFV